MSIKNFNIKGLSDEEVIHSRQQYGSNTSDYKKPNFLLESLKKLVQEPLIIVLLLVSSTIYFITGKTADALFLLFLIFPRKQNIDLLRYQDFDCKVEFPAHCRHLLLQ